MKKYDNDYSESFRKFSVKTTMRVLLRLRVILKAVGLDAVLTTGKVQSKQLIAGIVAALEDGGVLNEFCQVVTGKDDHDFMDEEAGVVMWVMYDFFGALYWQMPQSWREGITKSVQELVKVGQIAMMKAAGGTIQKIGSTASE
jgi:hypothetical protein